MSLVLESISTADAMASSATQQFINHSYFLELFLVLDSYGESPVVNPIHASSQHTPLSFPLFLLLLSHMWSIAASVFPAANPLPNKHLTASQEQGLFYK